MMVKARKRFGQNFLEDKVVISRMLDSVTQAQVRNVLEIGPGLGALTVPMLKEGLCVHCIELDFDIIEFLNEKLSGYLGASCTLQQGDILQVPLHEKISADNIEMIFSNLPYNISTPFFLKLVFEKIRIDGYFLVQKEVAQRLCAAPGETDYGRLTVMLSTAFSFTEIFDVPPTAFSPQPKVQSTFIKMSLKKDIFPVSDSFEDLIRQAFSQRRKKISNTLKSYDVDFQALGIDSSQRPQDLSLPDYIAIYNSLEK